MKNRSLALALTAICLTGLVGCSTPSVWTAPTTKAVSTLGLAPKASGEIHPFLPIEIIDRDSGPTDGFFLEVEGRVVETREIALW